MWISFYVSLITIVGVQIIKNNYRFKNKIRIFKKNNKLYTIWHLIELMKLKFNSFNRISYKIKNILNHF